jgi:hypothetical protein
LSLNASTTIKTSSITYDQKTHYAKAWHPWLDIYEYTWHKWWGIWSTQSKRTIIRTLFWHSANFQVYIHYNELEESLEASICTTKQWT